MELQNYIYTVNANITHRNKSVSAFVMRKIYVSDKLFMACDSLNLEVFFL